MNRPSFQFYPADWRGNTKLRRVGFVYRGIWIEVMCLLHDSDEYGLLRWSLDDLAAAVGCHPTQLQFLADRGILKGAHVGQRSEAVQFEDKMRRAHIVMPPQAGPIWFSSRMLIDEYRRNLAVAAGKKGGNPTLKGGDKGRLKMKKKIPEEEGDDGGEEADPVKLLEGWEVGGLPAQLNRSDVRRAIAEFVLNLRRTDRAPTAASWKRQMHRFATATPERFLEALGYSLAQNYRGIFEPGTNGKADLRSLPPAEILSAVKRDPKT